MLRALDAVRCLVGVWVLSICVAVAAPPQPLALHPDNPHYLLFRGRPTVLVTSTEHYGAVLNRDFDYVRYLDELQAKGLNLTRTFSGVYCEDQKSFGITGNTMAPAAGRLMCPWARSTTAGYANGGNRFDLTKWDAEYFARLKDFVAQAGRRGVVVEFVLFCPFYEDALWNISPMKESNNVNGIGRMPRIEVYTTKHAEMVKLHETLTRKIVGELAEFDNLYYEVCNEPYFGGVTGEWQDRIIAAIVDAESKSPKKHLIARNIANGSQKIENPNPAVSIFNFHYATPPDTVTVNYGLNKVIADDETGFKGSADATYRGEAWDFFLAGGAIYDNLDYSFTSAKADGSAIPNAPGGGGVTLRTQLKILKMFLEQFDFVKMAPDRSVIQKISDAKVTVRALSEKGKQYAVYVRGNKLGQITLDLPKGSYQAQWVNTATGEVVRSETIEAAGQPMSMKVPTYQDDIALSIKSR